MSAINQKEISLIRDEDLLKKMWQETEDFGKKKEIRAHMYKLREARLKDLYCNNETKEIQTSVKTSFAQSTHADSLADHSFASLKSKEIRDSESPTRDVSYRITGSTKNHGWNVSKIDERSEDGKTHKIAQVAKTSGTEIIPMGKLDFQAENKQQVTTFQDGDENNMIRSQESSSSSVIRQEAKGGDEHSNFRSSSTQSRSTTKTYSEQKSYDTTNDKGQLTYNNDDFGEKNIKIYTTNASKDMNNQSEQTGGYTRTSTETRSFTNKYQDDNDSSSRVHTTNSSTERKGSQNYVEGHTKVTTGTKTFTDTVNQNDVVDKSVKVYTTDAPSELKKHPGYVEGHTKVTRETKTLSDGTVVTTTKYETTGVGETKTYSNRSSFTSDSRKENRSDTSTHEDKYTSQKNPKSRYYVEKTHTIPSHSENVYQTQTTRTSETHQRNYDDSERIRDTTSRNNETVTRKNVINSDNRTTNERINQENERRNHQATYHDDTTEIRKQTNISSTTENLKNSRNVEKIDSVPLDTPIEIEIDVSKITSREDTNYQRRPSDKSKPQKDYKPDGPTKRELIKPAESEWKCDAKPTEGQYSTTYNTDYTNKKISNEVSPTHDAFARSLRAVSPDRLSSRTNPRSNSSSRNSFSPEKTFSDRRHSSRVSPGRCISPSKKTPDRFSSSETITYRSPSRQSSERHSPVKSNRVDQQRHSNTNVSSTINTRRSSSQTTINRDTSRNQFKTELITDLDDGVSSKSFTLISKNKEENVAPRRPKEYTERPQTSPLIETLTEKNRFDRRSERPLKRTDTYEERCRQILGISNEVVDKRKSSIEKLKRRGSANSTQTITVSSTTRETEERKNKSPTRKSPVQYPATKRRSLETPVNGDVNPKKFQPSEGPNQEVSDRQQTDTVVRGYQESTFSSNRKIVDQKTDDIWKSPDKQANKPLNEYPSQNHDIPNERKRSDSPYSRKSPERTQTPKQNVPDERKHPESPYSRKSPERTQTSKPISEFPAQIRRSPERVKSNRPLDDVPRKSPEKTQTSKPISEFPSQIRRSPEKPQKPGSPKPVNGIPENDRRSADKVITEFPSQVRKSPEKPIGKISPGKTSPSDEFPAEKKRTPTRESPERVRSTITSTITQSDVIESTKPKTKQTPVGRDRFEDHISLENTTRSHVIKKQLGKEIPDDSSTEEEEDKSSVSKESTQQSTVVDISSIEVSQKKDTREKYEHEEFIPKRPQQESLQPRKSKQDLFDVSVTTTTTSTTTKNQQKSPEKTTYQKNTDTRCQFIDESKQSSEDLITNEVISINEFEIEQTNKTDKRKIPDSISSARTTNKIEIDTVNTKVSNFDITNKTNSQQQIDKVEEITVTDDQSKPTLRKIQNIETTTRSTKTDENITKLTSQPTQQPEKPKQEPKSKKEVPSLEPKLRESSVDTDGESEDEVIETHVKKNVFETYEGRTPVEEPLLPKKNVNLLYSDDEDIVKKNQLFIESEITDQKPRMKGKEATPKNSKVLTSVFITKEKASMKPKTQETPIKKAPQNTKKPLVENNNLKPKPKDEPESKDINKRLNQLNKRNEKSYTNSDSENIDDKATTHKDKVKINKTDTKHITKQTVITSKSNTDQDRITSKTVPRKPSTLKPSPTNIKTSKNNSSVVESVSRKFERKETAVSTPKGKKPQPNSTRNITCCSRTDCHEGIQERKYKQKKPVIDSSESDEESIPDSLEEFSQNKVQTTSKHHTKPVENNNEKPKFQKKVISTKNITKTGTVDLQRSMSSREPTPDRVCPLPVTSDDDDNAPRYPDNVVEPDEVPSRKPYKNLFGSSIRENEEEKDFKNYSEITVNQNKIVTEVDRVDKNDESLLTVNKKINKFSNTVDSLTEKTIIDISQPAPKVQRPKFDVGDDLREDDCLLSVSDKVNKFINEAEHLTSQTNRQVKKTKTDEISKISQKDSRSTVTKTMERTSSNISLSSTEGTSPNEPKSPKKTSPNVRVTTESKRVVKNEDELKISETPSRSSLNRRKTPESPKTTPEQTKTFKKFTSETTRTNSRTNIDNQKNGQPKTPQQKVVPRNEFTPKNRRPSQEEKVILSSVGRLRSSESILKAKALFDKTKTTEREEKRQVDILSRPSIYEDRKRTSKETTNRKPIDRSNVTPRRLEFPPINKQVKKDEKLNKPFTTDRSSPERSSPARDIPGYMRPLDRSLKSQSPNREDVITPEPEEEQQIESSVPVEDLPGYMKPLNKTPRPHSPKRDVPTKPNEISKFGVTLKKPSSHKLVTETVQTTQKVHPIFTKKIITEEDIEQIYELSVLEELLLKITGYELRRKIRTQIKTVKTLISENRLETTIQNKRNEMKITRNDSRTKVTDNQDRRSPQRNVTGDSTKINTKAVDNSYKTKTSEYTSTITRRESTSSYSRSGSPPSRASKSPDRQSPVRQSVDRSVIQKKVYTTTNEENRPVKLSTLNTTTTNYSKDRLRSTELKNKTSSPSNQPEWVGQRSLKKVTNVDNTKKTTYSTTNLSKKQTTKATSTTKKSESTDIITSSYGVGPTDENGTPLFGLRALRAPKKGVDTQVKGTVISSEYYSETGKEPRGQISVTNYSTDPRDLGSSADETLDGEILSVTTVQKFGYDQTPSLKQLRSSKKEICDADSERSKTTSKSATFTRRNSVKALTQKFVENTDETIKNERQSTYPKAGLILRSSSFKNDSSRTSSDDCCRDEEVQESVSMTSSTKVVSGGTFLKNKSKITGMQDVINRMKSEDVDDGDSVEDIEARDLLNKYLGSSVILSSLEGCVSKTATATARATSTSTRSKNRTTVTTVVKENGKEETKTRVFEHPISDDVLDTVWDEQTLRYLLEESTDYEERKRLRARLRQLMAEQEACTELVKQASQDQSGQSIDESTKTTKKVVSTGPVTTTKVTRSVITQQQQSKKAISPFAKFRQLDKQNSLNTPPSTPRTPGGSPLFKFTDAALSQSASTIKDRLLHWCRMKTKEYENIQLDNFSSSWADGLAFCALIHHFLPEAFDYHVLTPKERRQNFELAFRVADEKADIAPLLDVDDMVATRRPDWKCVFTYVQSIYRRFKDED